MMSEFPGSLLLLGSNMPLLALGVWNYAADHELAVARRDRAGRLEY